MFKSKKAQQALEFMVILVFSLTLITIAMYVSGVFLTGMQEQDKANTVKNFVESINKEISILSRVEGGFYRELEISSSRYNINITQDLLLIKDLEDGNKSYYYDLVGDFNVEIKKKMVDGREISFIVFQKGSRDFYEGLDLEENGTDISEEILSFTAGNLSSTIVNSINCPYGYIPLYRFDFLTFINMSHGQINSVAPPNTYPYTSCIFHGTYGLNTPSTCSDENRLFYLGAESSSHLWLDNSTAMSPLYPGYYDWKEVCLERDDGGIVEIVYDTANLTSQEFVCVGSYYTNDMSMGANLGTCLENDPLYTKIWVRILDIEFSTFSWKTDASWGSCSLTCGGGTQSREVWCERDDGLIVSDSFCSGIKPIAIQSCNNDPCLLTCPAILNLVWDADRTEFTPLVDANPPGLLPNGNPWCYYQITNGDTYCGSWDRVTGIRYMTGKCCGNLDYNKAVVGGDC